MITHTFETKLPACYITKKMEIRMRDSGPVPKGSCNYYCMNKYCSIKEQCGFKDTILVIQ